MDHRKKRKSSGLFGYLHLPDTLHVSLYCGSCLTSCLRMVVTFLLALPVDNLDYFFWLICFCFWRLRSQNTNSLSTEMSCCQRKLSLSQRTWEMEPQHKKHGDIKYIKKPQTHPGGSVCNYYTALSGNNLYAAFQISISVTYTKTTFNPLHSSSFASELSPFTYSLPHCHPHNSLKT